MKVKKDVREIRDFVAKNIRSAGPSLTSLPLDCITDAKKTLADGYGNTTDRAVLLYALLKRAGFEPEFVLASGAPRLKALQSPLESCPMRTWFGSVLVRVKSGDEYVYLNDTNQYAAVGSTPHDGRPGILLPSGKLVTISSTEGRERPFMPCASPPAGPWRGMRNIPLVNGPPGPSSSSGMRS